MFSFPLFFSILMFILSVEHSSHHYLHLPFLLFTFFLYALPRPIIPPPPPPDGMQSTLLVSEASMTGRMFLSSATAAALSPSVVGLSDALCRSLTLTHNTLACCVVACYFSVLSRFRPLYFPGSFFVNKSTSFYKTDSYFLNGILIFICFILYLYLLLL